MRRCSICLIRSTSVISWIRASCFSTTTSRRCKKSKLLTERLTVNKEITTLIRYQKEGNQRVLLVKPHLLATTFNLISNPLLSCPVQPLKHLYRLIPTVQLIHKKRRATELISLRSITWLRKLGRLRSVFQTPLKSMILKSRGISQVCPRLSKTSNSKTINFKSFTWRRGRLTAS